MGMATGNIELSKEHQALSEELCDQYLTTYDTVTDIFDGDRAKAKLWMTSENPLLGEVSPAFMIFFGRYEKLTQWVQNMKDGNLP